MMLYEGIFAAYRGNRYGPYKTRYDAVSKLIEKYFDKHSNPPIGFLHKGIAKVRDKKLVSGSTIKVIEKINISNEFYNRSAR